MYLQKESKIDAFEKELWNRLCCQNDEDYTFSDLTGLYVDIINVISKANKEKTGIIYDYAKLLEQEIQLYSGTEAYIEGRDNKSNPLNEVVNGYMRKVMDIENEQGLVSRIQKCFDEITEILGDKRGLISEFTELYRTVHGVITKNIHEFIQLGQTSDTDMLVVD